jgi:hypothetical protein
MGEDKMEQVKKWQELTWDELANLGEIFSKYEGVFKKTD